MVNYKADSGSPRKNTIVSREQFKPIRIRENLVVNCNFIKQLEYELEISIT